MSRAKKKASLAKNIYYTMFLLCRHLTFYDGEMEAAMASMLVSFVTTALILGLCSWLEMITGLPLFGRWLIVPALLAAVANDYLFLGKDRGDKFGDEFSEYSELKQTLLYVAAVVTVIGILAGAWLSLVAYRHAHGFPT